MLSRRCSIRLSLQAVTALVALGPVLSGRRAQAAKGATEPIDWDTFLVELQALTRAQHAPDWDQAAYVKSVVALMHELDVMDAGLQEVLDRYRKLRTGFPQIRTAVDGGDYSVSVLQFAPGDSIALHNHPRMTGVILCLTGAVEVESYTLLEGLSEAGEQRMKQDIKTVLRPGDHATLTATRGNIHGLEAREWCELLDVFTPPYTADRAEEYSWFARSSKPVEGTDVYAVWKT